MHSHRPRRAILEPLEARYAPALVVLNPLPDLTPGPGFVDPEIDLSRMFDEFVSDNGHTIITLETNFDADPETPGIQPSSPIVIEMLDDEAPLAVQNFLRYLTDNTDPNGDYVGTFFHRSVPGFVIQGGGFDVSTPGTHIPTPFDVHNEFDGVNRSNLEGTLAMAKSVGPHTANSEWFFNLANNSSNLDNQNGGFTVFARVVSGFEVVKAIAALETYNFSGTTNAAGDAPIGSLGGALTDLPLQNYQTDPDQNPATPAPTPSADQSIVITGMTVTPPPSGTVSGIAYSFTVTDAETGQPSDLVTGAVNGSKLQLQYKAHAAGRVNVTVQGTDGSQTGSDTFTIDLRPNLVAGFEGDPFDGIIIGGDTKTSPIVIGNTGGGWAVGPVNVKVYLSARTATDSNGVLLEPAVDRLIGEFLNESVDIASGGTATLLRTLEIPKELVTNTSVVYKILVEVTPADGTIVERFADDNVALDSDSHLWLNQFGTFSAQGFGERKDAVLSYTEADGDVVSLSIDRAGTGEAGFDGNFVDVTILSAKPKSVFSATVTNQAADGAINLHNIELPLFMDRVDLREVSLSGSLAASGGVRHMRLGDVIGDPAGDSRLTMGVFPADQKGKPTLSFQRVADFSVESLVPIKTLRAVEWLETGGPASQITAPFMGSLLITGREGDLGTAVRGDFEADVLLRGQTSLQELEVAGVLKEATVVARGDVGKVRVGGFDHAELFVGVSERPDRAGDFNVPRTLGSLIVRGVDGGPDFIDSEIAAAKIGSIVLRGIDGAGSEGSFGVVADVIRSYNRGSVHATDLRVPQAFDRNDDYLVRIL